MSRPTTTPTGAGPRSRVPIALSRLALGALVLGGLSLMPVVWPFLVQRWHWVAPSSQDSCTFGTITRDKYADIAAEMKRQAPINLKGLVALHGTYQRDGALAKALRSVMGRGSSEEQLARLHAALRAEGAYFSSASERRPPVGQSEFTYNYGINLNLLGEIRPICYMAAIVLRFSPSRPDGRQESISLEHAALLSGDFVTKCNMLSEFSADCPRTSVRE